MKNFLFLLFIPFISLSQTETLPERPSFKANLVENSPELDGNILEDKVWKNLQSIGLMVQTKPSFGLSSSEKTAIKVAFSKTVMFVGVVCYDSSPNTLVVSDSRRDASLDDDDSFLFIIDTYNDQQNGFLFGTCLVLLRPRFPKASAVVVNEPHHQTI